MILYVSNFGEDIGRSPVSPHLRPYNGIAIWYWQWRPGRPSRGMAWRCEDDRGRWNLQNVWDFQGIPYLLVVLRVNRRFPHHMHISVIENVYGERKQDGKKQAASSLEVFASSRGGWSNVFPHLWPPWSGYWPRWRPDDGSCLGVASTSIRVRHCHLFLNLNVLQIHVQNSIKGGHCISRWQELLTCDCDSLSYSR